MLDYMPRDHREFILYLRKTSTVKNYGVYIFISYGLVSCHLKQIFDENINEAKIFSHIFS